MVCALNDLFRLFRWRNLPICGLVEARRCLLTVFPFRWDSTQNALDDPGGLFRKCRNVASKETRTTNHSVSLSRSSTYCAAIARPPLLNSAYLSPPSARSQRAIACNGPTSAVPNFAQSCTRVEVPAYCRFLERGDSAHKWAVPTYR